MSSKNRKSLFIIALMLLAFNTINAQTFKPHQLWKASKVYDLKGVAYENSDVEQFIYIENKTQLFHLDIRELLNMENGETIIEYRVDTFNIVVGEIKNCFTISGIDKLKIEIYDNDSVAMVGKDFVIPFTPLLKDIPKVEEAKLKKELYNNSFQQHPEGKEPRNYVLTYSTNNTLKHKELNSDPEWTSAFKIINFHNYIFLKGITSSPFLVTKLKKNKITTLEIDSRHGIKNVSLEKQ